MPSTAPQSSVAPCVLIVEDDCHVCELVADILSAEGFETRCVTSDRLAYDALESEPFAGLLVDINLGVGATGYDVARFARQIDPALPVVYVSGQTSQASFAAFGVPGSLFVAKPFTAGDLMLRLRALMGANEP